MTSKRRRSASVTAALLAAITALVYTPRLQDAPVYFAHDEVRFALQAHSIATSGRDLNGRLMPVYFSEPGFSSGRDPISIYATALALIAFPFSETTIRSVTAVVGIIDVVLMYVLARLIFTNALLPLVAAGLLLLTPAHFLLSRLATSVIYPLPFTLGWLICLVVFIERRTRAALLASMGLLGLGVYSYLACMVTMPVCFLLTWFALFREKVRPRFYVIAAAGFLLPLVPLLIWHVVYPTRYADIVREYGVYDSARMGPLQGVKDLASYFSLGVRSDVYWRFFGPTFLFFFGDASLIDSTREAGVFTWPVGLLLPLGIYQIIASRRTTVGLVLLMAFALAPLAAVISANVAIHRGLVIVVFGVLIATYGVDFLLSADRRRWRLAGVLLLLFVPVHFRHFYVDYFHDYRVRSSGWFEHNIRGGAEELIDLAATDRRASVYLGSDIPFIESYWSFYLIKHHQEALQARTVYYDPKRLDLKALPERAVVLTAAGTPTESLLIANGWRTVRQVAEPGGDISFSIDQR